MTILGFQHFNDNFETKKMREKPNFAENWNNEARKPMKNEN